MDGRSESQVDTLDKNHAQDTSRRTTLDDAVNGYRLFLGRYPANSQELLAAADCRPGEFISYFLLRGEFISNVVNRLADGSSLPHAELAPQMDEGLARWASGTVPLTGASRNALSASRSWRFWILTMLRDPDFTGFLPPQVLEWWRSARIAERIATVELVATRQLIGEIADGGSGQISGWCANPQDFNERIVLELFLGSRFIGVAHCMHFVPGLAERIGGRGEHGFSFRIPALHDDLTSRGTYLSVRDAHSKKPFGSDIYIKTNLQESIGDISQILAMLKGIKQAIGNIEQHLPHAVSRIAPTLDAYAALRAEGLLESNRRGPDTGAERPQAGAAASVVNVVVMAPADDCAPLRQLIASLGRQSHPAWTLTVLTPDEPPPNSELAALLAPLRDGGQAVRASAGELPRLITTHPRLRDAGGHLVVEGGGALREDALAVFLAALASAHVAYSDHDVEIDRQNGRDGEVIPVFKPDFDPVTLLAYDCLGPMVALSSEAMLKVFALENGTPPGDLHDLSLRLADCIAHADIRHISSILYTVRKTLGFHAGFAVPRLLSGNVGAVRSWVQRNGLEAVVRPLQILSGTTDPDSRTLVEPCAIDVRPSALPSVSVIVPTRNSPVLLRNCLDSLLRVRQDYRAPMQIIVIDHQNEDPDSVGLLEAMRTQRGIEVMPYQGAFNWAVMNNLAASMAQGEVLAFLNDDTVAASNDWLRRAVATLALPEVGVVGARLLYRDGSVQHGGVVTSREQGAVHEALGARSDDGGYLGRNLIMRSAAAVTGACLVTRRSTFEAVQGFDPSRPVNWNDIVYCLAVRKTGLRVVYDPEVCLYHYESKTRGYLYGQSSRDVHQNDLRRMREEWGDMLDDPYHNRNFARMAAPFSRLAY